MTIAELLLAEFNEEAAKTRVALERMPPGKASWKPHAKSMALGELAAHLAEIPWWTVPTLTADSFDLQPPGAPQHQRTPVSTAEEALSRFDEKVAAARQALAGATDERLQGEWSLLMAGRKIFTLPRVTVLRNMVLNHTVHHRAQLGVYYRLLDVPVPSTYGPSADERISPSSGGRPQSSTES